MTKILVDNKEPKEILEALHEMKIPCEYIHLEVGDYIIGKTIIERKTIKDFKNSIIDNRLWNQAKALSLNNGNKIIVVIGYPYLTSDYPIVFGAISSPYFSFTTFCSKLIHSRKRLDLRDLKSISNNLKIEPYSFKSLTEVLYPNPGI